ncbi:MAG: hypothetical protein R2830_09145 [Saprospiraceae bacterium]
MQKPIITLALIAVSAAFFLLKPKSAIVNPADYEAFMVKNHIENAQAELAGQISFWKNKLEAQPTNFVYQKKLAGLYAADFKLSAQVESLRTSDSLLQNINHRFPGQVGVLQSLAANAITRHAFREAEAYMTQACNTGEKKFANSLMLTDVHLERGNFYAASSLLKDVASTSHFDFLIRQVKLQDQQGDLKKAIESMEQATALAKSSGSKSVVNWALSNLADMYGHDGRVEKSYQTYLEALSCEPADLHSLKGIAWVAFSHDKNTAEAKRILHFLQTIHPVPDYDLLLSKIAAFEQDDKQAAAYRESFIAKASNPAYGNMYKSYLCELKSERTESTPEALAIAKAEIAERPHPKSYSLLAWTSFQNGQDQEALRILQQHVMEQTGEPVALYHTGLILKATGHEKEARKFLEEALQASFELGPVLAHDIEENLAQL